MARALLVLLAVLAASPASAILRRPKHAGGNVPPEAWLTTPELIARWGYPTETHHVRTEDGYILEVHRVPGPRGSGDKRPPQPRAPVLLMHGFGSTSECMVFRPHKMLAFMLADADLDVWIGNFRGTFYGRRHVNMTTADPRFWEFSWHENGLYDVSAMLDYVAERTGQPSVLYGSHSMGGTALLVLLSERPQYNARVRASFMLTPAVYFTHVRGSFQRTRRKLRWGYNALSGLRMENPLMRRPVPELCLGADGMKVSPACMHFFTDAQGPFHSDKNNTYMPILLRHWPGGTSVSQLVHFAQLIIRGDGFFKFDFGPERNLDKYGTVYPPAYNLTNVRSPVFIFYCQNDYQAHYKDIKKLGADLPGLAGLYMTPSETFNHLDIMYDEDAADLVYTRLIEQMLKYR
ncbi:hypothetical protein ONE63_001477 [Megalurothrips usitatus]|uniref:Lipase n=1 Tax=Megalurothrips usitatus TaxID=439358 RepID=A0AAV7XGL7_9NEOP|nr:hypothetical protein ONE63_001477 [Megalurothrips usitatus]